MIPIRVLAQKMCRVPVHNSFGKRRHCNERAVAFTASKCEGGINKVITEKRKSPDLGCLSPPQASPWHGVGWDQHQANSRSDVVSYSLLCMCCLLLSKFACVQRSWCKVVAVWWCVRRCDVKGRKGCLRCGVRLQVATVEFTLIVHTFSVKCV